jgi:hypothetical protein
MSPKEDWRGSECQVISPGRWTRLNGTDAEILLPDAKAATLIRVRRVGAPLPAVGVQNLKLSEPVEGPCTLFVTFGADGQVQSVARAAE